MLSAGNTKLGLIANFNLEAGFTCTGKSKLCSRLCYARKGLFMMPSVIASHKQHWEEAKAANFVERMVGEIVSKQLKLVRIHASGDFKTLAYTEKWRQIVSQCPSTIFFLYTRSWRVEEIKPVLWAMSRMRNMRVWFSCDRETGRPPKLHSVRFAYMSENDDDMPDYPVDLIFRDQVGTPMIRDQKSGSLVCPYEQGIARNLKLGDTGQTVELKMTCAKCQLCFNKDRMIWARPGVTQKGKTSDGESKSKESVAGPAGRRSAKGKGLRAARRLSQANARATR